MCHCAFNMLRIRLYLRGILHQHRTNLWTKHCSSGRLFLYGSKLCKESSSTATQRKLKFELPPELKLFENTKLKPVLFRAMNIISALQLTMWVYLTYSAYSKYAASQQHDKSQQADDGDAGEEKPLGNKAPVKEDIKRKSRKVGLYRFFTSNLGFSVSFLSLGAVFVFAAVAYIYPLRVVKTVTYHRPSQVLQIVTYNPLGRIRRLDVPLLDVTCRTTAEQLVKGQNIALKVKHYPMAFMVNRTDAYYNPVLNTLLRPPNQTK